MRTPSSKGLHAGSECVRSRGGRERVCGHPALLLPPAPSGSSQPSSHIRAEPEGWLLWDGASFKARAYLQEPLALPAPGVCLTPSPPCWPSGREHRGGSGRHGLPTTQHVGPRPAWNGQGSSQADGEGKPGRQVVVQVFQNYLRRPSCSVSISSLSLSLHSGDQHALESR